MPVPWPSDRDHICIPDVAERALTIKQLFDLRTFLQRLCKAKLLRRTSDAKHRSPDSGRGTRLNWHDLNLYDVTDEVIKPIIHFREMRKASSSSAPVRQSSWRDFSGQFAGYSWAELVSAVPQRPQLMVSHWWGGPCYTIATHRPRATARTALTPMYGHVHSPVSDKAASAIS